MELPSVRKYTDTHLFTFGYGDGGGGPTEEMLENYRRLEKGIPGMPKVKYSLPADAIDKIHDKFEKSAELVKFTSKWKGELYFELHRGTYTTIAKNKKNNRKSEYLYQDAEALSITNLLFNDNAQYPTSLLDENWHTLLKNQFHDIIPGSSIKEVYDDSDIEYAKIFKDGNKIKGDVLSYLADNVNGNGDVLIYNPTPFTQSGVVNTQIGTVYAKDVPAHSWKVIRASEAKVANGVKADKNTIENNLIKVTFNEKYHITSIYDKANERELIPEGAKANVFEVFENYPKNHDAWEITEYYKQKKWIAVGVDKVEVITEDGVAGIRIYRSYRSYMHSTFIQTITLKENSHRLDFDNHADWHEEHVLLKTSFPLDILTDNATYDIQFGHIQRPTHKNTSWDEAMFEVSGHKWADLSDFDYGVSLLNDCKYGYSCEENVLKLTLLNAPTYPNPDADRGEHDFTYSIFPMPVHLAKTLFKEGYLLNNPLEAVKVTGKGNVPAKYCLVGSSTDGFAIETVKKGEYGDDIILRGYECFGGKRKVTLTFGFDVKKAYLCNLMENNLEEIEVKGNTVSFTAGTFEIVTLKLVK